MSKDQRKQQLKILNTYEKLLPVAECESSEETMLHVVTNEGHASTFSGDTTSPFVPPTSLLTTKLSVLSSKLGLPKHAIEGIAKKAVDILITDGAITQVPGHSNDAKIVLSYSGKRPHLVLPKRKCSGMFCDDDCPQYKSGKLCSHTVAAAQYNGKLDSFIASYSTTNQT